MHEWLTTREVFHFCFLEWLFRISDPALYVLKGGVNLRFFFQSPRYSEDLDLDVRVAHVATLKKNGYKMLTDPAFTRILQTYGIASIDVNDPAAAKQTETTQRFRVGLVTSAGIRLPTKIEFSRRPRGTEAIIERIPPALARRYGRLAFRCQHYAGPVVIDQKIRALAGRVATQARDVFDLYTLILGGHAVSLDLRQEVSSKILQQAQERLLSLQFVDYVGQVVEFLEESVKAEFGTQQSWDAMQTAVLELLNHGL